MSAWPERYEQCRNCDCPPEHRAYGGRGYCRLCYYLVRRIELAKNWNRARPETLRGIASGPVVDPVTRKAAGFLTDGFSDEEFENLRSEYIRQAKARMRYLRTREDFRSGAQSVDPLDIEYKFARLLHFLRPKAQYPRNASHIARHFNQEQRRVLYGLLDEIEEHMPWEGFILMRALEAMRRLKR